MYNFYFSLSVDIRVLSCFLLQLSKKKTKFPQQSQNIWLKIRVRNKICKINSRIEFHEEKNLFGLQPLKFTQIILQCSVDMVVQVELII